tara:strand:- start:81 stop:299 length:219 start_codon:yes stop_codon:yes gene_type:complete
MSNTPIDAGSVEWTMYRFHEIDEDDLFWLNKDTRGSEFNPPHRKINEKTGINLVARQFVEIESLTEVYIKDQ